MARDEPEVQDQDEDPNEEVGREGINASTEDIDQRRDEIDDEERVEATLRDEVAEQFPVEPIALVMSEEDGMPVPADESVQLALAPSFTRENVICVEDDRSYVELFAEELTQRGWSELGDEEDVDDDDVGQWETPTGWVIEQMRHRDRYDAEGLERTRRKFDRDMVRQRWGQTMVQVTGGWLPVKPVRERCKYYKRQVFLNEDVSPGEFGAMQILRNCTMRRSLGGAFLSLRDEAVVACDYRDPPCLESVKKILDDKDQYRLDNADKVEQVPLFNLE